MPNSKQQIRENMTACLRMGVKPGDRILLKQMSFNKHRIPDFLHMQWVEVDKITSHWTLSIMTGTKSLVPYDSYSYRRRSVQCDDVVALARNGVHISLLEEEESNGVR